MTLKVIESKSWQWQLLTFFLIVIAIAASAWSAWYISGQVRQQLKQQVIVLTKENQQLKENAAINELKLTELDRSEQMASANVGQSQVNLAELQEEKKQLEKELSFYRSIMAPELDKVGLNIQNFAIVEIEKGVFEFSLTLTQMKKQDWYLKGNYTIELISEKNGAEKKHSIKSMLLDKSFKARFSFRYFQTLISRFQLSEELTPQAILVTATTKSGKQKVTKRFPWTP